MDFVGNPHDNFWGVFHRNGDFSFWTSPNLEQHVVFSSVVTLRFLLEAPFLQLQEDPVREAELNVRRFEELWEQSGKMDEEIKTMQEQHDAMGVLEFLDSLA